MLGFGGLRAGFDASCVMVNRSSRALSGDFSGLTPVLAHTDRLRYTSKEP